MMQFQFSIYIGWKDILENIKTDILFYFGKNEYSIQENIIEDRMQTTFKFYDPRDYITDISALLYRNLAQSVAEKYKTYYVEKAMNTIPSEHQEDFIRRTGKIRVIMDSAETIEILKCMLRRGDTIALDGFFRFVMRPFRNELKHRIDLIAEDILVACEYADFIDLMREFTQDRPHAGHVYLYEDEQANLTLYDENMQLLPETTDELFDDTIQTPEDGILSTLLTISPQTITVHSDSKNESPVISTIKQIFTSKIDFSKK